jgi:hypothetical protein
MKWPIIDRLLLAVCVCAVFAAAQQFAAAQCTSDCDMKTQFETDAMTGLLQTEYQLPDCILCTTGGLCSTGNPSLSCFPSNTQQMMRKVKNCTLVCPLFPGASAEAKNCVMDGNFMLAPLNQYWCGV